MRKTAAVSCSASCLAHWKEAEKESVCQRRAVLIWQNSAGQHSRPDAHMQHKHTRKDTGN